MNRGILKDKTYEFAILIVKVYEDITSQRKEYVLSKQLLRSGTSIGAMVREAEFAQSRPDFINKMSVALKEANETLYWIHLLRDTYYIDDSIYMQASQSCREIISILVASVKTSKANK